MKRGFTDLQRAIIIRALKAPTDEWLRAQSSGERVTFASLHARHVLERRVRREGKNPADNAYEYRASKLLRDTWNEVRKDESTCGS
jgi:hypothetical protein